MVQCTYLSCRVQDPLILPGLKDTLTLSTSYNRRNRIVSCIVQVQVVHIPPMCICTVLWLLYVKVKVSERFSQTVYGCMWRTVKVDFFPEVLGLHIIIVIVCPCSIVTLHVPFYYLGVLMYSMMVVNRQWLDVHRFYVLRIYTSMYNTSTYCSVLCIKIMYYYTCQ